MRIFLVHVLLFSAGAFAIDSERCDSGYPIAAARQGIEGFVQLGFDISTEGKPVNIKVIKSEPAGVFDEPAKCALSKWQYSPKIENGVAVTEIGVKVQLDWDLNQAVLRLQECCCGSLAGFYSKPSESSHVIPDKQVLML